VRALDDISITVAPGDRLGIIGHNGAGKTSLLRLMSGAYSPSAGEVICRGTPQALTDFTLGMDTNASGLQNIYFRLAFMGYSRQEAEAVAPEIIDFSELGDFIHYPLHTYSTGMYLRLAFAISTQFDPDILIMDEVLGAGDARFRERAKQRMDELIHRANALVLSSHVLRNVIDYCNRVVVLQSGKVVFDGSPEEAVKAYHALQGAPDIPRTSPPTGHP
jgi:ABC-type polysaccharide/polyol phosphate transport system ATPase subunit